MSSKFCLSCNQTHAEGYPYCTKVLKDPKNPRMQMKERKTAATQFNFLISYVVFFPYKKIDKQGNETDHEEFLFSTRDKEFAEQVVKRYNFFVAKLEPDGYKAPSDTGTDDD